MPIFIFLIYFLFCYFYFIYFFLAEKLLPEFQPETRRPGCQQIIMLGKGLCFKFKPGSEGAGGAED